MNVLVIGDDHTYGYGLPAGQFDFVEHLTRQLNVGNRNITVETHSGQTLAGVADLLSRLPLKRYDLIVLQIGQRDLLPTPGLWSLFSRAAGGDRAVGAPLEPSAPADRNWLTARLKRMLLTGLANAGQLPRLTLVRGQLRTILDQVRPYRHHVLLLTPLPHREPVSGWLRARGRHLFLREGLERGFSVFDTDAVVLPRDEYFLPDDPAHLNAVGHELLGRALFDFYQNAPSVITIQSIRRS